MKEEASQDKQFKVGQGVMFITPEEYEERQIAIKHQFYSLLYYMNHLYKEGVFQVIGKILNSIPAASHFGVFFYSLKSKKKEEYVVPSFILKNPLPEMLKLV